MRQKKRSDVITSLSLGLPQCCWHIHDYQFPLWKKTIVKNVQNLNKILVVWMKSCLRDELRLSNLSNNRACFADPLFQHHVSDFQEIHVIDCSYFFNHSVDVWDRDEGSSLKKIPHCWFPPPSHSRPNHFIVNFEEVWCREVKWKTFYIWLQTGQCHGMQKRAKWT